MVPDNTFFLESSTCISSSNFFKTNIVYTLRTQEQDEQKRGVLFSRHQEIMGGCGCGCDSLR